MGSRNLNENKKGGKKGIKNDEESQKKKPFDKKKYRQQKYSNKFKVNQWEERRRKTLIKRLNKDLQKEEKSLKFNFSKKGSDSNKSDDERDATNQIGKIPFFSAKQEFRKKQEEKKRKQEEMLKAKQEREEALKKYKERKTKAFKELSKKTKKGQPVMKGRLELLLEKIQRNT